MALCRICGEDAQHSPAGLSKNGFELLRCSACTAVLAAKRPEDVGSVYNSLFADGEYEQHRAQFDALRRGEPSWGRYRCHILKRIERLVAGRVLVEVGGGTGAFGYLARKRGWRYVDYDISTTAVDFVRRLGLEAHSFAPSGPPPIARHTADAIVMWEVIEHIWDVSNYLHTLHDAIKPGGLLVLSTPNWLYQARLEKWGPLSSPPIHCNFFTPHALLHILTRHGFKRVIVGNKRIYRPGRDLASAMFSMKQLLSLQPAATLSVFAFVDAA